MIRIAVAGAALAAAGMLLWLRVSPVPTWFYVFAWYPTLVLLDAGASRLDRRRSLLVRPALALSLWAWSPIVWLAYEAVNLRLRNWYYVLLPAGAVERWTGILVSFATVLPALVLAERLLDAGGVFARRRLPPVSLRPGHLRAATALALAALALALLLPRWGFPLIWGVGLALAEPLVYRRSPELSLLRDVERGDWGRVARLLLGGLAIGLLWELYNHWADGGWIYTVPGLERLKLFEMPPLGFLGFPVFALSAWALYAALSALRVAVPVSGGGRPTPRRTVVAGVLAAGFAVVTLLGMDRFTISSTASTSESRALLSPDQAALASLRGLGAAHARTLDALGVRRVCDLPGRDDQALAAAMRRATGSARPTAAEVRVWIRAARRHCP